MRIDVYDPETRPDLMRANEVDKENTVIMEYEKRKQYIKEHTELEVYQRFKETRAQERPHYLSHRWASGI